MVQNHPSVKTYRQRSDVWNSPFSQNGNFSTLSIRERSVIILNDNLYSYVQHCIKIMKSVQEIILNACHQRLAYLLRSSVSLSLFVVSCRAFFIAKKERSAVGGFLGNGVSVKCQRYEGQISCGRFPGKPSFGQKPMTKKCLKVFRGVKGGGGVERAKLEEYFGGIF